MSGLQAGIFTLLSWFLYVGIVLSIGTIALATAYFALGNRHTAKKLFISGLMGLLLGASANNIVKSLVSGINIGPDANLLAAAIVICLIVCATVFFGLGRREEGVNYTIAAVLAAGFIALVPALQALFSSGTITLTGTCMLDADVTPTNPKVGEQTVFEISMPYGSGQYGVSINFGDGKTAKATISPGKTISVAHAYKSTGTYSVLISATGKGKCFYALAVNVGEPPSPWFLGPFDMSGLLQGINQILKFPINLFYWTPELDLNKDSEDMKLYFAVASVAMSAFGLFLTIRIVSGFFEKDPSASVVGSIKDAVLIVAVILSAPYLYQTFAVLCNQVSSLVIAKIDVTASIGSLVLLLGAAFALGVVSSFAGTFGGVLLMMFLFSSFTAVLRYALIKAIVYCIPLLAVAYLFPAARGAVKFFMNVLAGLVVAGPVAAFILASMSGLGGTAGYIGAVAAPALTFFAFPIMLAMASGASPGAAASALMRVSAGALAGFRGPTTTLGAGTTNINPHPSGESPSQEEATQHSTTTTPTTFVGRDDYVRVMAENKNYPHRQPADLAHRDTFTRPGDITQPDVSTQPDDLSQGHPDDEYTPDSAHRRVGISSLPALYNRAKEWYNNSVFKQKIYPRWTRIAGKYGQWMGYGYHVAVGSIHPYTYRSLKQSPEQHALVQKTNETGGLQKEGGSQSDDIDDIDLDRYFSMML